MNEFREGRPPTWRIVLYALIAMAIPAYFFYPRIGELHQYQFVFWILLIFTGLMIISIGILPSMIRNNPDAKAWMVKNMPMLRWALFIFLLLNGIWKLFDLMHNQRSH